MRINEVNTFTKKKKSIKHPVNPKEDKQGEKEKGQDKQKAKIG